MLVVDGQGLHLENYLDSVSPAEVTLIESMQDRAALLRYKRRWIVERTFSWWRNFRRLVVRWDYHIEMYQDFINVACMLIVFRQL
tara:strand:- start:434 stop:688 length:255 start_codon:yes stop_codon:yes gene_type:complete